MTARELPAGRRLFIALWPAPAVQRELAALATLPDGPSGVATATENLHLTLAFLGHGSAAQQACYQRALAQLKFAPMTLQICRLGFWRAPRILWAGPKDTPAALTALAEDLHALLRPCGFVAEPRPLRAHVTLRRKYPGPAPDWGARAPVHWRADTLALVWSQSTPQGVRYRPVFWQPASSVQGNAERVPAS